jgi:predicted transcriptional regulator/DNA-binding XRE family transcriptional regulator
MPVKSKIGSRIRRLRSDRGLTQVELAGLLGISASYLNLIEHNQRALTVPLLFKIGNALDVDLENLAEDQESRLIADIQDALKNPIFEDIRLSEDDIADLVGASPEAARALLKICRAHGTATDELESLSARLSENPFLATSTHRLRTLLTSVRSFSEILHDNRELRPEERQKFLGIVVDESEKISDVLEELIQFVTGEGMDRAIGGPLAADELTDFLEARRNFFEELEAGADRIRASFDGRRRGAGEAGDFEAARALAAEVCADDIAAIVEAGTFRADSTRDAVRRYLEKYVAAAVVMPYDRFLEAAEGARYDIERLAALFGASFEQVCHRLTTLSRPGSTGIPFHFMRADIAGNISKRYSASGLRIPRSGGVCPRWNVHAAPASAGRIDVQLAEMPDGARYQMIARAEIDPPDDGRWNTPRSVWSLLIGCDAGYAPRIVYADGLDVDRARGAVEVGTNCRVCERENCAQRAFPSFIRPEAAVRGAA